MWRIVTVGALAGVGVVIVRSRLPALHERLVAQCEAMFEQMPDSFPPKRMLHGIDDIRGTTARILELLEPREDHAGTSPSDALSAGEVHDVA